MKRKSLIPVLALGIFVSMFQSCENQDNEFPNFDHSAVYFGYQDPVRTLCLGQDENYNTDLDNAHQCEIYAVLSGMYSNKGTVSVDVTVDNSLCDNLYLSDGQTPVKPMPSTYYSLLGNQIVMNGTMNGAVKVQFTDAFFADPNSIKNTYVIPLRMTKVTGADSILEGKVLVDKATGIIPHSALTNSSAWNVLPQNYVLYCVKYINQWAGSYLRRGVDVVTENGTTNTIVRHKVTVEQDDLFKITTNSLKTVLYPFNSSCNLLLNFTDDNKCTVTSATDGYTVSGTGTFVKGGEKKAWGNKDRDAIYLDYKVTSASGKITATKDTLVIRDRGIAGKEQFSPVYKSN